MISAALILAPADAVRLGVFWSEIRLEPADAARLAWGGGLDVASARLVLKAFEVEHNRHRLGADQRH